MSKSGNFFAMLEKKLAAAKNAAAFEEADGALLPAPADRRGGARGRGPDPLGVEPGDRVMVQVEKSIANVFLYLATLKVGAVFNPLNTAYTPAELEYFIGDAKPTVIVGRPSGRRASRRWPRPTRSRALLTMEADGCGSFMRAAAEQKPLRTPPCRAAPTTWPSLIYTSGTTGRSKGAMITHRNIASNAETLHAYWGFQPGDVLLHALPIFHVHGLFVALHTALLNGSTMLWLPKFDSTRCMRLAPRDDHDGRADILHAPARQPRSAQTCRNLRLFISGSAPLLAETHREFTARTGHTILERYGMTEAGMITSNP